VSLETWFLSDDRRLRSGWRVGIYLAAALIVMVAVMLPFILVYVLTASGAKAAALFGAATSAELNLAAGSAMLPCVMLLTWTFRRFLDRRSWRSLGFWWDRAAPRDLGLGFVVGVAIVAAAAGLLLATGSCAYAGLAGRAGSDAGTLLGLALLSAGIAAAALLEELICRGYIQGNLAERCGAPAAIAVSSLIFGAMHGLNGHVTLLALANLVLAGTLLGLAFHRCRTLWLPWGLHFGWNLAMGPALGIPVSGTHMPAALHFRLAGPAWWSGGDFGIEGGLAATQIGRAHV
jgi:uncharacterized protein